MNCAAELQQRPRDGRCSVGGVGDAVGRGKDAASPRPARYSSALARLCSAQHVRGNADGASEIAPSRPGRQLFLAVAEIEQSTAPEAGVLAGLLAEALPEIETLRRHRQLARIAVLLAAPAPIAARLLGAHATLLE